MAVLVEHQLEIDGLSEAKRRVETSPTSGGVRTRILNRIDTTHDLLTALPTTDDLLFNHSGLCQTFLPHSRLSSNQAVWKRESGRFILMVQPGVLATPSLGGRKRISSGESDYVGVPYGTKARLIMFHLQTEGVKSRTVPLGKNLSAFLRSLDLPRTGGPRGSINQVREQ